MSNRGQCVFGGVAGVCVGLVLYAGPLASCLAALAATGATLCWRRSR